MVSIDKPDDVEELRRRSPEAYAALLDLYGRKSLRFALQYAGNIDDAKDIVQDTIIKVWKKIETYNEGIPFNHWYFKILVNTCRDWRKNAFRRLRKPLREFEIEQVVERKNNSLEIAWLKEQIIKMPPKMRMIFILHYLEDFTISDISELLDRSVDTIRVQIMRGRQFLRKLFEEQERQQDEMS